MRVLPKVPKRYTWLCRGSYFHRQPPTPSPTFKLADGQYEAQHELGLRGVGFLQETEEGQTQDRGNGLPAEVWAAERQVSRFLPLKLFEPFYFPCVPALGNHAAP